MKVTAEMKVAEPTGATLFKYHIEREAKHLEMLAKEIDARE
jgi:hypothetical protein